MTLPKSILWDLYDIAADDNRPPVLKVRSLTPECRLHKLAEYRGHRRVFALICDDAEQERRLGVRARDLGSGASSARHSQKSSPCKLGRKDHVRHMASTFASAESYLTRSQRLARAQAFATLLDAAFVLPGTNVRLGLDAIIGLVPGVGDTISTLMALWILREAHALGVPRRVLIRMAGNIALDAVAGAIPVIGDIVDVAIRANLRNVQLMREHFARETVRR